MTGRQDTIALRTCPSLRGMIKRRESDRSRSSSQRDVSPEKAHQHNDAEQATKAVGGQIVQTGLSPRQGHLSPFIQDANQKHGDKRQQQHAPPAQPRGRPDRDSHQGVHTGVCQFVPWGRYESDGKRLGAKHKESEQESQYNGDGNNPQMSHSHISNRQDVSLFKQIASIPNYLKLTPYHARHVPDSTATLAVRCSKAYAARGKFMAVPAR